MDTISVLSAFSRVSVYRDSSCCSRVPPAIKFWRTCGGPASARGATGGLAAKGAATRVEGVVSGGPMKPRELVPGAWGEMCPEP
jgi:hypothetical protein